MKNEERIKCKNPVLQPAFDYIFEKKGEDLSQKHIAEICHISTSYFSRIFPKEVGESYSGFISRLNVQRSKHLLEDTNWTIVHISEELGFNDVGYYIRTFKKYENVTPAVYRKFFMESRSRN